MADSGFLPSIPKFTHSEAKTWHRPYLTWRYSVSHEYRLSFCRFAHCYCKGCTTDSDFVSVINSEYPLHSNQVLPVVSSWRIIPFGSAELPSMLSSHWFWATANLSIFLANLVHDARKFVYTPVNFKICFEICINIPEFCCCCSRHFHILVICLR